MYRDRPVVKEEHMRIMQVSSATSWGGGEQHLADLIKGLARRGHQVELTVRRSSPLVEACAGSTTDIHELRLRNSVDLSSARRLRAILRERKIDILHAHLARDYAICALAVRNIEPVRLVLT
ncbi:MAG: glycosyltransferase, partial [Acidobacteria bacterium]|nr:glycosyltransferase [Acidobacteriota bacterium]